MKETAMGEAQTLTVAPISVNIYRFSAVPTAELRLCLGQNLHRIESRGRNSASGPGLVAVGAMRIDHADRFALSVGDLFEKEGHV